MTAPALKAEFDRAHEDFMAKCEAMMPEARKAAIESEGTSLFCTALDGVIGERLLAHLSGGNFNDEVVATLLSSAFNAAVNYEADLIVGDLVRAEEAKAKKTGCGNCARCAC